jgi:hypothetical protein
MKHAPTVVDDERRVKIRHACKGGSARCAVEAAEKEERWPGQIRDVSAAGMGLLLARRFEVGTLLEVEAEVAGREALVLIPMHVIRVERTADGAWFHGCVFEEEVPEAAVRTLLRRR